MGSSRHRGLSGGFRSAHTPSCPHPNRCTEINNARTNLTVRKASESLIFGGLAFFLCATSEHAGSLSTTGVPGPSHRPVPPEACPSLPVSRAWFGEYSNVYGVPRKGLPSRTNDGTRGAAARGEGGQARHEAVQGGGWGSPTAAVSRRASFGGGGRARGRVGREEGSPSGPAQPARAVAPEMISMSSVVMEAWRVRL